MGLKTLRTVVLIAVASSCTPWAIAALHDRGGGMIYDDVLNITWMADANPDYGIYDPDGYGFLTWQQAMDWAANLDYGGFRDWRLPTTLLNDPTCQFLYQSGDLVVGYGLGCRGGELGHMFFENLGGTAGVGINESHNDNYHLFSNIQINIYWTSTPWPLVLDPPQPAGSMVYQLGSSFQGYSYNTTKLHAWAVRDGDVAAVDTTPPSITPTVVGVLGQDQWYTSAVSVLWNIVDSESLITSQTGCDATTLTADTEGVTLTCTATSGGGTGSSAVTIKIDATPPSITCTATPDVLGPANHKLMKVSATVNAADSQSGVGNYRLVSVTSNELDSGLDKRDIPNDIQDWTLGVADVGGLLRAERADTGSGRIYAITYEAADAAGNLATCKATSFVPHDQGKGN